MEVSIILPHNNLSSGKENRGKEETLAPTSKIIYNTSLSLRKLHFAADEGL